ncbi:MAG: Ig-like domain-containing protein [Planctomycetota bacterium]
MQDWTRRLPRRAGLWALLLCTGLAAAQAQTLEEGLHYFAVEDLDTQEIVRRGITGSNGIAFSNLILAPNRRYRIYILQASSFRVGVVELEPARPASRVTLGQITLLPPTTADSDGDGLHDLGETIVNTRTDVVDTDGDGVNDAVEVQTGEDPLSNVPAATGLIASLDLPGVSRDLCAMNELLVVAHDNTVTGLNVFTGLTPEVVSRINLPPSGLSVPTQIHAVACSGRRVAIAAGAQGFFVADMTTPAQATLTVALPAGVLGGSLESVAAAADVAYCGDRTGGRVVAIDMRSGSILGTRNLGSSVRAVSIEGDFLYALTNTGLSILDLDPVGLGVRGSVVQSSLGTQALAVANGVAYGVKLDGWSTTDVSDPDAPALIAGAGSLAAFDFRDIGLEGSGLGIVAGYGDVAIYDVSDPSNVDVLQTLQVQYATPGASQAVLVANGLAYVADGDAGLQVVRFRAFDTGNLPPSITLVPGFDPAATEEGKRVFLRALVDDDTAVRNVEFTVNGVTTVDLTYPFELQFVTPSLADQASFTFSARVFDTGGNQASAGPVTATLVVDATPPVVERTLPMDQSALPSLGAVAIFVSEQVDPASVTAASFTLTEAGPDGAFDTADDVAIAPVTFEVRPELEAVFLTPVGGLQPGSYRARATPAITDLAGNPLATDTEWRFLYYGGPAADTDGDGLPDLLELALGLDPNAPDTGNTGTPDGDRDFDGDGLTNAQELALGTNPIDPDSDADGIADGLEDDDQDGLTTLQELGLGTQVFVGDSDGDGFSDGDEVQDGSSPLDGGSVPLFATGAVASARNDALDPGAATGRASARNDALSLSSAVGGASARNTASPDATRGVSEGPSFTLENQAP